MRRAWYSLSVIALLGAVACGSDDNPAGPPPPPTRSVATITVTPGSDSLAIGDSVSLTASALDSIGAAISGTTFAWTSSDSTVATVSTAGMVMARAAGTATISAGASSKSGTATITVTDTVTAPVDVRFSNVFVVGMLEQDYSAVFGPNPTKMPFLDSLSKAGAAATGYFGNTHPSIGNFYTLLAGDTVTNDDNNATIFTGDNLIRQLIAAGKTWKSYAQSIPGVGYIGSDNGRYIRHHNVASLLTDVTTDSAQRANLVNTTQLTADIAAGTLPNFGMIVPDECYNSHLAGCGLDSADAFLRSTLTPLLASPAFQAGGNGMVIILFDRSHTSQLNGGGKVAWVAVGPRVKSGFTSATMFQHASTLRLVANSLGLTTPPGAAASAPSMSEFLTTP